MVRFRNFVKVIMFAGKNACVLWHLYLSKYSSYSYCDIGCVKLNVKQLSFYYGSGSHGSGIKRGHSEDILFLLLDI